jgi:hypothetical protein
LRCRFRGHPLVDAELSLVGLLRLAPLERRHLSQAQDRHRKRGFTLFCEHGTWQMLDCATLYFVPCKGEPYQQSWTHSPGAFKLQGVQYDEDSFGIFNCGPNDC